MQRAATIAGILTMVAAPGTAGDEAKPPAMEMVSIPGGTFTMGEADGEFDEKPEHQVTVSSFEISKYEVTFAQYRAFAKATGRSMPEAPDWEITDRHPVVNVSWQDAAALAEWLGSRTGETYRLPTEAEWSYVARAGKHVRYAGGSEAPGGNVADDSGKATYGDRRFKGYHDGFVRTAPVGSFEPNAFGVFDLDGNAAEWCLNWHYEYDGKAQHDPRGPDTGENKVFRGASFLTDPWYSRIAQRNFMPVDFKADYLGIRLVRIPRAEAE